MPNFIVERTPKGFNVFKMIKPLIGKEKKIEVSKNDFFNYSSVCLKETNKYTLCPNIEKMSMDTYLKEKAYYNNKHYFSDFNMRTTWTYDIKNEEIEEFEYEEEVYYLVRIIGIVNIYAPNGKMLTRIEDFKLII